MTAILEMRGVSKSFSGVQALRDVNFTVEAGQIHALVGENIFLSHPPQRLGVIDRDTVYSRTQELLAQVGLTEMPDTLVTDLGVGKQQLVEIAKALSKRVRLLILDEPTASLNEADSAALLERLLAFRAQGIASILISHKLSEVARVADRITVLRDGRSVDSIDCHAGPPEEDRIIRSMVNRDLAHRFPQRTATIGEPVFTVQDWTVHHPLHRNAGCLRAAISGAGVAEGAGTAG